jgi:hypothetical protein
MNEVERKELDQNGYLFCINSCLATCLTLYGRESKNCSLKRRTVFGKLPQQALPDPSAAHPNEILLTGRAPISRRRADFSSSPYGRRRISTFSFHPC